jgi:hypothetical protein
LNGASDIRHFVTESDSNGFPHKRLLGRAEEGGTS